MYILKAYTLQYVCIYIIIAIQNIKFTFSGAVESFECHGLSAFRIPTNLMTLFQHFGGVDTLTLKQIPILNLKL